MKAEEVAAYYELLRALRSRPTGDELIKEIEG